MPKTIQQIKKRARRGLSSEIKKEKSNYVIDSSAIINKEIPKLIERGIQGKIIIPNSVMAELENMANKGREEGFIGLEEVSKLHHLGKNIEIFFDGLRPNEMQIRFAKSGEIDALIRESAIKNKAVLVTADLVQAKTAQAYGIEVIYFKPKIKEEKKPGFLSRFWKKKK